MNELIQRYLNYLNLAAVPVITPQGIEYLLKPVSSLGGGDNVSSFGSAPTSSEQSAVDAGYGTITAKNPMSETRQAVANVLGMVPGIGTLASLAVNPNRVGEMMGMFGLVGPGMTVASEFGPTPASVGASMAGYGFPGDMFGEFGAPMSSYSEAAADAASGMTSSQSAESAGFGSDPSGEGGGTSDAGGDSSSGGGDTGSDGSFAEGGIVNLLNYYYGKR